MYIFRLSGEYIGFMKDAKFYSTNGEYCGWLEGEHVWDKEGFYRGKMVTLNDHTYILKDTLLVDPPQRPLKNESPTEQLQPQLNIDPLTQPFNIKDSF